MTPVQAIIAKELRSYFVSPVVYAVGSVFLLIVGLLAYLYVVFAGAQAIQLTQMQGSAQINLNDLGLPESVCQHTIYPPDYPADPDDAAYSPKNANSAPSNSC